LEVKKMRSVEEINKRILSGEAVVLTAEEVVRLAKEEGVKRVAEKVDVVTTATFAPMCSSGAFVNFGHTKPPMRMEKIEIEGVEVYGGLAAVDGYVGATQESKHDKSFGGAHIIELLIKGKNLRFKAEGKGTDCYPRKQFEGLINRDMVNDFFMFNPRNAYQNYAAATNISDRIIYTYMGKLLPHFGNVTYSTSGELSPLLKDPKMLTIGLGTKIFLCGTEGYVVWPGTQFRNDVKLNEHGIPISAARTLAVIGDAKKMNPRYLRAAYFKNYGVTIFIGIGVPIPVLNEEIAYYVSRSNEEITTELRDYGKAERPVIRLTNYAELRSGWIEIDGKKVKTSPISSLAMAREIAQLLKRWIVEARFILTSPVKLFDEQHSLKRLEEVKEAEELEREEPTCVNCGMCVSVCPYDALKLVNDELSFERNLCTECGLCSDVCPVGVRLPPL
jgi:uncharacterized protein (DUF39 family)/ferredoxin